MKRFAVVSLTGGTISNVVVGENIDSVWPIVGECVEETEDTGVAAIGYTFDPAMRSNGAFYPPQPFSSWTLDEATLSWVAPVPRPTEGGPWRWDDSSGAWISVATGGV